MRVLVIGGTRFIGPYVVRGLHALGHGVTVFHQGEHTAELPVGVKRVCSPDAAMPVMRFPDALVDSRPDVVIHMVAMGEPDMCAAVNAFAGRIRAELGYTEPVTEEDGIRRTFGL